VPKILTREQLDSRKEKAERFVRDVVGDPERADEIADESLEDYADRRKIQLADNPRGGHMAVLRVYNPRQKKPGVQTVTTNNGPSRVANALKIQAESERLYQLNELQRENEILQDKFDKIADLASAPEDEKEAESLTQDDLKDSLNKILDVAAPGEADEPEGDEGEDED
jgi:hypothetical protein